MKNPREIKGPTKVNTHAIIGQPPQKNKAPDSQTSQATCQTKEIDRAHRPHSTREAKQNKTNKNNQGSPTIKTIQSHDSILVPLTRPGCNHRRVCTGHAIPYTYLQMCGGLKTTKVSFGRTSSAGLLFFLVPGGHEFFRSLQHPLPCATALHRPSSLQGFIRLCQLRM